MVAAIAFTFHQHQNSVKFNNLALKVFVVNLRDFEDLQKPIPAFASLRLNKILGEQNPIPGTPLNQLLMLSWMGWKFSPLLQTAASVIVEGLFAKTAEEILLNLPHNSRDSEVESFGDGTQIPGR